MSKMEVEQKFIVRKAKKEDIPQIIELWKALLEYHNQFYQNQAPELFRYKKDHLQVYKKYIERQIRRRNACIFVAVMRDGKIIGHIMVQKKKVPPLYVHDSEASLAEFFVDKSYRNMGVGTRLLKEIFRWTRGKGLFSISINVNALNSSAQAVYEKAGFRTMHYHMRKVV